MDGKALLTLLTRQYELTAEEWEEVTRMTERHPYSATLRLLWLAGAKAWKPRTVDRHCIAKVSLYVNEASAIEAAAKQAKRRSDDIMQEINDYKESSFKTAPKSVILSEYLDNITYVNATDKHTEGNDEVSEDPSNSEDALVTETMAVIFERQGKLDRAIATYEKLMVKYPEKKSTFATHIERLRREATDGK